MTIQSFSSSGTGTAYWPSPSLPSPWSSPHDRRLPLMIEVTEDSTLFLALHVIFARYFLFAVMAGPANRILEQRW
jgi:hypothetical protein